MKNLFILLLVWFVLQMATSGIVCDEPPRDINLKSTPEALQVQTLEFAGVKDFDELIQLVNTLSSTLINYLNITINETGKKDLYNTAFNYLADPIFNPYPHYWVLKTAKIVKLLENMRKRGIDHRPIFKYKLTTKLVERLYENYRELKDAFNPPESHAKDSQEYIDAVHAVLLTFSGVKDLENLKNLINSLTQTNVIEFNLTPGEVNELNDHTMKSLQNNTSPNKIGKYIELMKVLGIDQQEMFKYELILRIENRLHLLRRKMYV